MGYDRKFLDLYRPNVSFYLTEQDRAHLATVGRQKIAEQPAGTYAKQILNRLLIDLSWNSSRLEGNTYSLLDTKRLIELGQEAKGRAHLEAQMILNHKDAIEFLVAQPTRSASTATQSSISTRSWPTTSSPIPQRPAGCATLPSASNALHSTRWRYHSSSRNASIRSWRPRPRSPIPSNKRSS